MIGVPNNTYNILILACRSQWTPLLPSITRYRIHTRTMCESFGGCKFNKFHYATIYSHYDLIKNNTTTASHRIVVAIFFLLSACFQPIKVTHKAKSLVKIKCAIVAAKIVWTYSSLCLRRIICGVLTMKINKNDSSLRCKITCDIMSFFQLLLPFKKPHI